MRLVKGIMIFACIAFLAASCAKAPLTKIEEAKKAVSDLKADKEVSSYAKEAMANLDKSVQDLDAELKVQEGKLFKSYVKTGSIIDSIVSGIDDAKKSAVTGKESAKNEVKTDLVTLPASISSKEKKVADAKAKGLKIDFAAAKTTFTDARKSLADAKIDNDKGEFADALDKLNAVKTSLKALDDTMANAAGTKTANK